MDDQNNPSQNPPADPNASLQTPPEQSAVIPPPTDTEEQKMLEELKNLEHEEQTKALTDSQVIDKREEAGKELEKEAQNPTPTPTPDTTNNPPETENQSQN